MNRRSRALNFESALHVLLVKNTNSLDSLVGTRRPSGDGGDGNRHRHWDEQVIRLRRSHATRRLNWDWERSPSPLGACNSNGLRNDRTNESVVRAIHRDHSVRGLDLEQWVILRVNGNRQSLAVGAQVKVGARWVHALVASAGDGLSTSNSITDSTVANLVGRNRLSRRRRSAATIHNLITLGQLDKGVVRMLLIRNGKASLARVEIGALDALVAFTHDAVLAEIARSIVEDTSSSRSRSSCSCRFCRSGIGNWSCNWRGGLLIRHRPDMNHHLSWSMKCDKLMRSISSTMSGTSDGQMVALRLVDHASIAKVKVGAIETLVADANDGLHAATITGDAFMPDGGRDWSCRAGFIDFDSRNRDTADIEMRR